MIVILEEQRRAVGCIYVYIISCRDDADGAGDGADDDEENGDKIGQNV